MGYWKRQVPSASACVCTGRWESADSCAGETLLGAIELHNDGFDLTHDRSPLLVANCPQTPSR